MISAFGAAAERYARGLGALDAVIADPTELAPAYLEAVRRRECGSSFYGMVLLDDPQPTFVYRWAHRVLAAVADYDTQLAAMDQLCSGVMGLDDRPVSAHWELDAKLRVMLGDFYRLSTAMLVRSFSEYARLAQTLGAFVRPVERVLVEPQLPDVARRLPSHPTVVVWAPHRPALETTLHAFALRELFGEIVCVTAGGALPDTPHATFVEPSDPRVRAALATAGCVVCAEPGDPGDAVAFARRGYGVVAPLGAGAHEFAGDVVVWDGAASTLHHRVATALGRPATVRAAGAPLPPAPPVPPLPLPANELPLVSVVCPTYNRPNDLRQMLACLAAQTYPNLECIVVNDAGTPVADVVAAFPFARLIDHERNAGALRAMETGVRDVRGAYIQLMADDDLLYPDHIARVMGALLRSGGTVAHGSGLSRIVERDGAGAWTTRGLNALTFAGTATPSEALVAAPICYHQIIQQRQVFSEVGWFRTDMSLSDQEMLLRLAQRYTFVYVDHVTSEFRDHLGGMGKGFDHLAEQRRVYDELHPVPGRALIAQRRADALVGVARRTPGQPAFTPVLQLPLMAASGSADI